MVDDDKRFCTNLRNFLQSNHYKNTSIFYTEESILELMNHKFDSPDIVLLDINFSDSKISGYDILKAIKSKIPESKIIMITAFGEDEHARFTIKHGANGFVNKIQDPQYLLKAFSVILQGGVFADPGMLSRIISSSVKDDSFLRYDFTWREKEIIEDLLNGVSIKSIADKTFLSVHTINYHIKNIILMLNTALVWINSSCSSKGLTSLISVHRF
ncbi:MAG: response regulator transcription factor [Bacteroidota bacterium]